jgi:type IV fimbrial biogenesis protein FimT
MNRKHIAGFTIIELMLSIALAGVLLAIAAPSYTTMVLNNCLTTKANGLVSALQLARSSAITFHDDVTVGALPCSVSGGAACSTTNEFGSGVVVFRDIDGDNLADAAIEDADGDGVLDAGEDLNGNGILDREIIKMVRFDSCAATMDETTGGDDTIADSTALVYASNGAATPRGTINICDTRDNTTYDARRITLSATGRPTTEIPTSNPCP